MIITSCELVEFYEEVLDNIGELSAYTNELSILVKAIKAHRDNLLNLIYSDSFNTGNGTIMNQFNTLKSSIIQAMQKFSMEFDALDNTLKLASARSKIDVIFEKYPIELED